MADKLFVGVNVLASLGVLTCWGVLFKKPSDLKLLQANLGLYVVAIVVLLLQALLASVFTKGNLLFAGFFFLPILYTLLSLILITKSSISDSNKMKLFKSLKYMQPVSAVCIIILTLYNQGVGLKSQNS
jgi:hypothetical protein